MPEQEAQVRARNFKEVPLGFSGDAAKLEAQRCLQCKSAPCVKGCPVNVQIPQFIGLIAEGRFLEAAWKIKETNALPAVCGRVCPQESQCEAKCVRGKKGDSVGIGCLERFVADFERASGELTLPECAARTGKKVAVVGSGPAGLSVAGDLIKLGHQVTVFEALQKAGGVLIYGIPEFRLPKEIVQAEVNYLKQLGVEFRMNMVVGPVRSCEELMKEDGYDAIFIGVGAGLPVFLRLEGENLCGIYSANEYLTRANLMKAYTFPRSDTPLQRGRKVVVIGGGNVAMDALRIAKRLGAEVVNCIYRRTLEEMPARKEEIHHAQQEGIDFQILRSPVRFVGDQRGWVKGIEVIKMELGEADSSGRRRPVPIRGSEYVIEADEVIIAIGAGANPLLTSTMSELKLNKWGYIMADREGRTSVPGVWAGGDIVTGSATVILAAGVGKIAAQSIHNWLKTEPGTDDKRLWKAGV